MNTSRFAADLNPEIGRGPRRKPAIDLRSAADVIPDGTPDPEVPQIAGQSGRVLVSRAIATMPDHFARFIVQHESPGVILIPSQRSIGAAIEGLLTVWLTVQVQQRSRFCAEGADAADSSTAAGFARATNARLQAPRDDYALCALNVLEGTVIGGCQPRHRHQEFLRFLSRIDQSIDPGLDVHQVFDN